MSKSSNDIDRMLMPPPPPKRSKIGQNDNISAEKFEICDEDSVSQPDEASSYEQIQKCKRPSSAPLAASQPVSSNVRFCDVIGHSAAKLRLDEALLPLALPSSLADSILTGVRSAPASILLHGPPGCGKTQLARALAGEAQAALIPVGPSDILSKFVGESEAAVRQLFRDAKNKAYEIESNCAVIFFDEIDALGQSRSGSGSTSNFNGGEHENSNSGSRRLLAEILIQMTALTNDGSSNSNEPDEDSYTDNGNTVDSSPQIKPNYQISSDESPAAVSSQSGIDEETRPPQNLVSRDARRGGKPRVIVVAATNRPEDCDPALLRRFAVRVLVGLPCHRDRKRIIRRLLMNIDHTIVSNQLNDLAIATDGWSGSDLESLTREAVMAPIRECLRLAAITKARSRKRQQRGGVESCQEGDHTNDENDDRAHELLLNSFRNLRPVSLEDFEVAISFWMGDQSTHGSCNTHSVNGEHNSYDSDSSSDEE